MAERTFFPRSSSPLLLLLGGTGDARPQLATAFCQTAGADCVEVDLGMGESPQLNDWVNRLNLAIYRAGRPVLLVANGLGCLVAAWWAEFERPSFADPVAGAFLIDPPDVDRAGQDPRLARLCASPRQPLPFPSALVASGERGLRDIHSLRRLAQDWQSTLVEGDDARPTMLGRARAAWPAGRYFLRRWLKPQSIGYLAAG